MNLSPLLSRAAGCRGKNGGGAFRAVAKTGSRAFKNARGSMIFAAGTRRRQSRGCFVKPEIVLAGDIHAR
jgi:hypothetical protein